MPTPPAESGSFLVMYTVERNLKVMGIYWRVISKDIILDYSWSYMAIH